MELDSFFYESIDYLVECRMEKAKRFFEKSNENAKLKNEIDSLVSRLKNALSGNNVSLVGELQNANRMYVCDAIDYAYKLGLSEGLTLM